MNIMGVIELMVIIHRWGLQMLKQTFYIHEGCKNIWITHLLHITLAFKLIDKIISLDGVNHLWILMAPLGGSINEDGNVGDLNLTSHLVKLFVHVDLFPYFKIFCHLCGEP
jgi:hypothetical protein